MKSEIIVTRPTFICITERWLASKLESGLYCLLGYNSYHNYRNDKVGSSVAVYLSETLNALQVTSEVTDCNSYSICAVLLGSALCKLLLVAVYRSLRALYEDTKMLCNHLDRIALRHERIVVMGDFNLPEMKWSVSNCGDTDSSVEYLMRQFIIEHNLIQIAYEPTRSDNLLDLIFVSSCFPSYEIETISPIGSSDHAAQILKIPALCTSSYRDFRSVIHCKRVTEIIGQVNWQNKFNDCTSADDYASKFTNVLKNVVNDCTLLIPIFRHRRFCSVVKE